MGTTIDLNVLIYARGAAGVPTTTLFTQLQGKITDYQHTISATCGFESMSCSFACTVEEALDWLSSGLMRTTVVCGPDGETIWEGYLARASATLGQDPRSLTLDGMANRIRGRYTTVLGSPGTTALLSDTASQALYGIKDGILSLPESDSTEATNFATTELARRKNPVKAPSSTIATGDLGTITITLSFAGWYTALDWLLTSSTTTTTAVTTTQVGTLLTAYVAVNNFLSTSTALITASGISATQYIAPDTTYRAKIEALLSQGNSSGQRLAWGVYEDRKFNVVQWAGATPSTYTYQRYLGDAAIYTSTGVGVAPWNVRPNAMYQVVELLDIAPVATAADEASRYFVERVTFSADSGGTSVTLEPQQTDALDALLARLQ